MAAFDDLLEGVEAAPRFRVPVSILLDADAYNRAAVLNEELEQVAIEATLETPGQDDDGDGGDVTQASPVERARELAAEMAELHQAHPPTRFVFEQLTGTVWGDLEDAHPKGDRGPRDPFWLAAMAASCVEPEGATAAGWERWRATLGPGQWETLRQTCETANLALFNLRPTRAATALLNGTRPSSTTAPPAESPSLDSVDD